LQVEIETEFLKLEPIGFVFVVFFGSILVVQFVAMLFHRFGTLTHILASTEIGLFSKKVWHFGLLVLIDDTRSSRRNNATD
jgi:chitin synthase